MPKGGPVDDDEQEQTIPVDDPEGRQRQEKLESAILAAAGAEIVEELVQPQEFDDDESGEIEVMQ